MAAKPWPWWRGRGRRLAVPAAAVPAGPRGSLGLLGSGLPRPDFLHRKLESVRGERDPTGRPLDPVRGERDPHFFPGANAVFLTFKHFSAGPAAQIQTSLLDLGHRVTNSAGGCQSWSPGMTKSSGGKAWGSPNATAPPHRSAACLPAGDISLSVPYSIPGMMTWPIPTRLPVCDFASAGTQFQVNAVLRTTTTNTHHDELRYHVFMTHPPPWPSATSVWCLLCPPWHLLRLVLRIWPFPQRHCGACIPFSFKSHQPCVLSESLLDTASHFAIECSASRLCPDSSGRTLLAKR